MCSVYGASTQSVTVYDTVADENDVWYSYGVETHVDRLVAAREVPASNFVKQQVPPRREIHLGRPHCTVEVQAVRQKQPG